MRGSKSVLVIGLVLALTGCGSDGPQWAIYAQSGSQDVVGDVVIETDEYQVTEADLDGGCAQLTVAGVTEWCQHYEHSGGGFSARAARVADTHFIDIRTDPSAREFVVWSNVSPSGRSVEPIYAADNAILVWIMEPGEAPWGVQTLGPSGELVTANSFVGLPAD